MHFGNSNPYHTDMFGTYLTVLEIEVEHILNKLDLPVLIVDSILEENCTMLYIIYSIGKVKYS